MVFYTILSTDYHGKVWIMGKYVYKTKGSCSTEILFEINEGIIGNVYFKNGCSGNLSGISILVEGMKAEDVAEKFKGVTCGSMPSSCPAQLAIAINQALMNTLSVKEVK